MGARPAKSRPGGRRAVREAPGPPYGERLQGLLEVFGNNRLAELLRVSPSQPSRWRTGEEGMGVESERRLLDLDYLVVRLLRLFPAPQAEIWLTSHNAHLGGRPVDVLRLRGAGPVIEALDSEESGAYA